MAAGDVDGTLPDVTGEWLLTVRPTHRCKALPGAANAASGGTTWVPVRITGEALTDPVARCEDGANQ